MAVIDFGNQDYGQLTADLVAAQRAQRLFSVEAKEEKYGARVDGLNTVSLSLTALGTASSRLDSTLDFRAFNVSNSDDGYVSVTSSGSSPPPQIRVDVQQIGRPDEALASLARVRPLTWAMLPLH